MRPEIPALLFALGHPETIIIVVRPTSRPCSVGRATTESKARCGFPGRWAGQETSADAAQTTRRRIPQGANRQTSEPNDVMAMTMVWDDSTGVPLALEPGGDALEAGTCPRKRVTLRALQCQQLVVPPPLPRVRKQRLRLRHDAYRNERQYERETENAETARRRRRRQRSSS